MIPAHWKNLPTESGDPVPVCGIPPGGFSYVLPLPLPLPFSPAVPAS